MTTHASSFRELLLDVIGSAHPELVPLERLYAAAESRIDFDAQDLTPPTLRGNPVNEPSWRRNLRNALQQMKTSGALVNERRNAWRLPTPNPLTALDVSVAWALVRQGAAEFLANGEIYQSTQIGQRYQIGSVAEERITVIRLDSPGPETVTRGEVERGVVHLNAAGGRLGRTAMNNTVAKETTIVKLHPQLRWEPETDSIVAESVAAAPKPVYADFGEAPDDDPAKLSLFARRVRAGQARFRDNLLRLYDSRCAVSDWEPEEVLEAAHIVLHSRTGINLAANGVLLRSDLHTLFDAGLMRIHPESLEVVMSGSLAGTPYWAFQGKRLRPRVDGSDPGRQYLEQRWEAPVAPGLIRAF